jgi:hypothetical protein
MLEPGRRRYPAGLSVCGFKKEIAENFLVRGLNSKLKPT